MRKPKCAACIRISESNAKSSEFRRNGTVRRNLRE